LPANFCWSATIGCLGSESEWGRDCLGHIVSKRTAYAPAREAYNISASPSGTTEFFCATNNLLFNWVHACVRACHVHMEQKRDPTSSKEPEAVGTALARTTCRLVVVACARHLPSADATRRGGSQARNGAWTRERREHIASIRVVVSLVVAPQRSRPPFILL
jgi:hypothetical protein